MPIQVIDSSQISKGIDVHFRLQSHATNVFLTVASVLEYQLRGSLHEHVWDYLTPCPYNRRTYMVYDDPTETTLVNHRSNSIVKLWVARFNADVRILYASDIVHYVLGYLSRH